MSYEYVSNRPVCHLYSIVEQGVEQVDVLHSRCTVLLPVANREHVQPYGFRRV
jgi:hypothetical protein